MLFGEGIDFGQIVSGGPWLVVAWVMWYLLTKVVPSLRNEIARLRIAMIKHNVIDAGDDDEDKENKDEIDV